MHGGHCACQIVTADGVRTRRGAGDRSASLRRSRHACRGGGFHGRRHRAAGSTRTTRPQHPTPSLSAGPRARGGGGTPSGGGARRGGAPAGGRAGRGGGAARQASAPARRGGPRAGRLRRRARRRGRRAAGGGRPARPLCSCLAHIAAHLFMMNPPCMPCERPQYRAGSLGQCQGAVLPTHRNRHATICERSRRCVAYALWADLSDVAVLASWADTTCWVARAAVSVLGGCHTLTKTLTQQNNPQHQPFSRTATRPGVISRPLLCQGCF